MTMTFQVPLELEEQLRDVPELGERLRAFLLDQLEFEKWRDALPEQEQASSLPWEELYWRFKASASRARQSCSS